MLRRRFAVEWVGEVFVGETLQVTGGTSLNITGAGPGAIADGGGETQLFVVEGGSSLHLSDMTLSKGNATGDGGAIYANQSSVVSFSGNMSFISNFAGDDGGAIYAYNSTVSWDGDGTLFTSNSAGGDDGGAIYAWESIVTWAGDGTEFISNSANSSGGAIFAAISSVSWDGNGTTFSNNSADDLYGGAIFAAISTVSWDGDGTQFSDNSAEIDGGAIYVWESTVSWDGDGTEFISNSAGGDDGGAISVWESIVTWDGDGTLFISNSAGGDDGGAIYANNSIVTWDGDGTEFISNSAGDNGGAISVYSSTVSWGGNGTQFSNNSASDDTNGEYHGGAIYAYNSTVSWDGDDTAFISNYVGFRGGAIYATESTVFWHGDGTTFSNNYAENGGASTGDDGGAIYATYSNVSWDGGTQFSNNSAGHSGGAILAAQYSNVSWVGNGTLFSNNSAGGAGGGGGAIRAWEVSEVSWDGDGTQFISNSAYNGGAISVGGTVSWDGDGTEFSYNSADGGSGGAIFALDATVSWDGDGTLFTSNSAKFGGGAIEALGSDLSWDGNGTAFSDNLAGNSGGAIYAREDSTVFWVGDSTLFSNNSADVHGGAIYAREDSTVSWDGDGIQFTSNSAGDDGGALYAEDSSVELDEDTTFSSNIAGGSGGALAMVDIGSADDIDIEIIGTVYSDNRAEIDGGAIFLFNCPIDLNFTEMTFQSNSAGGAGGAVAAFNAGSELHPAVFSRCTFSDNKADGAGGAVETVFGQQDFTFCGFEGNSAGIGGALRLGGTADVRNCSFLFNSGTNRGPAIAVGTSPDISGSSFDKNELYCEAGSYLDTEKGGSTARYETVCFDCPDWDECSGCSIENEYNAPVCAAPLEHTTANESGVTLETLEIAPRYWRATDKSTNILACYNPDACSGGVTGAEDFCASGYKGACEGVREEATCDCAVCKTDYSPSLGHTCTWCSTSRRQGLVAAAVVAALFAVVAVATIFKFLLSTEVEEGNIGCFRRRVLRAVPVQALKIIVVVWQILTQFADAANLTYPGVYQDFLSAVDVVNFDLGSVLAVGCLWSGIDFHGRLLVSTLGPLVVGGFLAVTYLVAVRRNGASGNTCAVEKIRHKHLTTLLLLTFLVYSSVSSMVFQTFACETLDDGIEYLRADYRIHCTDGKHKAFEVYAGFMVFVYPLGIPLLYAALLFQRRDVLAKDDEKRTDADKKVAQPIAGLWEAYRPERFYYEVIECGRRILLTGVVVFIFPNTAAQIAIIMLIEFFFTVIFEVLSPYASESDTWLSRGGHVIVFLSMFDLLLLKVDVSDDTDQSQAAFAGVLVAGHVLMILAIVVEVVGVCWASRTRRVVEEEEEEEEERPRVESGDGPAFERAPASWRSFLLRESVSEKTGPTRRVSGNVVTTGGP